MADRIVNIRHAAPAWRRRPGKRHETLSYIATETPVRLPELGASEMRLAYADPDEAGQHMAEGEDLGASLWEAEGRLWQAATTDGPRGRRTVGAGWLTGERPDGDTRRCSIDGFAARTPLSRLALLREGDETGSVVEGYVDEARAGLVGLVSRDLRLCDGVLYHAFQGLHVGLRGMDWFTHPPKAFAPVLTAHPRHPFERHGEWFVVRADRMDAIRMMEAIAGADREGGPLGDPGTSEKRRLTVQADGIEDVLATVNDLPRRLVDLLRRGSVGRQAVSGKMRDLDLRALRRPMALGSANLFDEEGILGAMAVVSGAIEDGLSCAPGIRIATGLRNARAYLDHVAAPSLGARAGLDAEDEAALAGMSP